MRIKSVSALARQLSSARQSCWQPSVGGSQCFGDEHSRFPCSDNCCSSATAFKRCIRAGISRGNSCIEDHQPVPHISGTFMRIKSTVHTPLNGDRAPIRTNNACSTTRCLSTNKVIPALQTHTTIQPNTVVRCSEPPQASRKQALVKSPPLRGGKQS